VVLNVLFRKQWHHGETEEEGSRLVRQVLEGLRSEGTSIAGFDPGDDAWFCFADRRFEAVGVVQDPDTYLRVAANRSTGYGALMWLASERIRGESEINNFVWLSDNPQPPEFDPRVVADPGYPLFHHPRSTLPLDRVRAAMEEFCRSGTGGRPAGIHWVQGELNGQRLDQERIVDRVDSPADMDPWA